MSGRRAIMTLAAALAFSGGLIAVAPAAECGPGEPKPKPPEPKPLPPARETRQQRRARERAEAKWAVRKVLEAEKGQG